MGDPAAHAKFPPSASYRWTECHASIQESAKAPIPPDTPQSIEGTDAHWLADQTLKSGKMCIDFYGHKMISRAKVSVTMAKQVQRYVDYVRGHHYVNGGEQYFEQRVYMPKISPDFWGSADCIQITKYKSLHVFDLKYGLWVVEADSNTQMMSYALGALTKYKHLINLSMPVTAHICQPRPNHKDGPFRIAKFSIAELTKFGNLCKSAIANANSDKPTYKAGEYCRFCPAEFICPVLNQFGRKVWI